MGGNAHEVARRTSGQEGKLLAFVNRRKDCQDQAKEVSGQKHLEGAVFVHNSTLALATRLDMEQRCQQFKTVLCNARSTLKLGIDIGDIDAVLLCSVPSRADSFMQRIGRGNRPSSKTVTTSFVGWIKAAKRGMLAQCGTYELYWAVAQQCLSIIGSRKEFVSVKSLSGIFEKLRYIG